jgi:hypothetical protein
MEEDQVTANELIPWLFGFTLVAVLLIGIWQLMRVRRAQRRGSPAVPGQSPETTATLGERMQREGH